MKFRAYGKEIEVVWERNRWATYYLGNEGKKRTAYDIIIPSELKEKEIKNYLEDILHEWATPSKNEIIVID